MPRIYLLEIVATNNVTMHEFKHFQTQYYTSIATSLHGELGRVSLSFMRALNLVELRNCFSVSLGDLHSLLLASQSGYIATALVLFQTGPPACGSPVMHHNVYAEPNTTVLSLLLYKDLRNLY